MRRNSLLIKVQVLNRLFTQNYTTLTKILLVSFLFIPLFSIKMRAQEIQSQEHQHHCPILLEFCHFSPLLCKNHKKPEFDKKIQTCKTLLYWPRALYFPQYFSLSTSVYFLQNTLFGGIAFKFVMETIMHHYYFMLLKSFI